MGINFKLNKLVSGWLWEGDIINGFQAVRNNHDIFDVVMPSWLLCGEEGKLIEHKENYKQEIIEFCREHDIKIITLIAGDPKDVSRMINQHNICNNHIRELVDYILENDLEGLNADYECLPDSDRDAYTEFILKLAEELHRNKKWLSIDLHPKTADTGTMVGARAQDWPALAKAADELQVMCYDQHHFLTTGPGPIAAINWVEEVIQYALMCIPQEKIIMGVPFYGYDWGGKQNKAYTYKEAIETAKRLKVGILWDKTAHVPYFKYQEDQMQHEVWFENADALSFKLDIVNKYNLRGISAWRLGGEDKENWRIIRQVLNKCEILSI